MYWVLGAREAGEAGRRPPPGWGAGAGWEEEEPPGVGGAGPLPGALDGSVRFKAAGPISACENERGGVTHAPQRMNPPAGHH